MTTVTTHHARLLPPRDPGAIAALAHAGSVARAVADRRDLWAPHVRFDPDTPHERTVWSDGRWEVRLGAWLPGQSTEVREHVGRPGAVLVLQGVLEETTWVTATDGPAPGRRHAVTRRHVADQVRSYGAVHVHAVANRGTDPAVALHVRHAD